MLGRRERGLRLPPGGGWPLDRILVGVGTLRTLRELALRHGPYGYPAEGILRPWDVALWSGVSAQGASDCLKRLHRAGLVAELPRESPGAAHRYRLNRNHLLCPSLIGLFQREASICQ